MEKVETIVLPICSNSEIYDGIISVYWIPMIKFIREKKLESKIKVFLLFGKGSNISKFKDIQENILVVDSEECFSNILKKTILGIQEINKKYDYDYLIRSNVSSFWHIENLVELIKTLPKKEVYAGPNNWDRYISGCGIIMSRDICQKIADVKRINSDPDDLQIGRISNTKLSCFLEYRNSNFKYLDTKSDKISLKYKILYLISKPIDSREYENIYKFITENNLFQIRINSPKPYNRMEDLGFFSYLTSKLYKSGIL
tara:strand:+ start:2190 stop:2960 length:771 start_codon:yes stop_codon:yes gene_type:complete